LARTVEFTRLPTFFGAWPTGLLLYSQTTLAVEPVAGMAVNLNVTRSPWKILPIVPTAFP
jgi:hypothetical protein